MSEIENERHKRFGGSEWTTRVPSVLDEAISEAIRSALDKDWIFGLHLFYYSGGGPDFVVFRTWQEYLQHVVSSRPDDRFIP
jgi:hypothetical protein